MGEPSKSFDGSSDVKEKFVRLAWIRRFVWATCAVCVASYENTPYSVALIVLVQDHE